MILIVLLFSLSFAVTPVSICDCECPGVATPGYWKNHPEAWPVEGITIGGVYYSKAEVIEWLNCPVKNDKNITIFRAMVAAKLNYIMGCKGPTIRENDSVP